MRNLLLQKPEVSAAVDVTSAAVDVTGSLSYGWEHIIIPMIVPLLSTAVYLCAGMSIMLFVERVYMAIVILCVKLLGKKRSTEYKLDDLKEDLERNKSYPMVLIQIPMYNEMEVYKLSIGAVCALSWPSDRLIVQVLDDSTNEVLRALVELECQKWVEKGVNVKYETRNNRNGYKAGALNDGMQKPYVQKCEFVAIFDADFQPDKDFLWRTIPYLLENPKLGLVQARWKFGKDDNIVILRINADECLMTRLQEMSLDYHFSVEQEVGSSMYSFFGFNGTAGVWRIQTVNDADGWKDRTTVEDMDLAVRASLKGWKFVFVGDLAVSFRPNNFQLHTFWNFSQFFSGSAKSIFTVSVLVPEVHLPKPIAIYIPATITILNVLCTPRSIHLLVFWILFENVMSLHRSKAAIIGLLEGNRVNEWVVTEKLGNTSNQKLNAKISKQPQSRIGERIHVLELIMGVFMLHCAIYNLLYGRDHFFVYLLLQAGAFFTIGFGHVGTFVSN
ncbi:hypothetical protein RHSIM_Rhsim03G0091800 [Rhododendron simsii]|uniref:glucomannan 4-beta-mannosyltransferase n=1 Tax=Rhododendron simsii TaxID=118357 RepID=A0A834LW73_RHOSS|nr:hypothetical protein RHSIM_Rhsim03G0091800 [Rhododendron simsii]